MAPRRVLVVSISGLLAGAERVTLDLVEGLDRRRFNPTVVVPVHEPSHDSLLSPAIIGRTSANPGDVARGMPLTPQGISWNLAGAPI